MAPASSPTAAAEAWLGSVAEAVASGDPKAIDKLAAAIADLPPPFAVRSSAVDEDGASASFAGQHNLYGCTFVQ